MHALLVALRELIDARCRAVREPELSQPTARSSPRLTLVIALAYLAYWGIIGLRTWA